MSRLEIDWPDEGAERVRAAVGRLRQAGDRLRARSLEERLSTLSLIVGDWTQPDSPWRRELTASLSACTPFHPDTVSEGLESALRAWDPESFAASARRELAGEGRSLAPFEWTTVVAGGAIPMPTLLSGLLPLAAGSPVLLRETSKDPVTAGLLARSIAARDETWAGCFEPISFPWSDAAALRAALAAPCVVATGSDETIQTIASHLEPTQRFVAYGHRFSIAVIGSAVAASSERMHQVAEGLAIDVARWDQSGCLSPVVVYLVDVPEEAARTLATTLSQRLDALARDRPRGGVEAGVRAQIATERAEARMRGASGPTMLCEGLDHTVVLEADARSRPAPLHRFIRLMPVASLMALEQALTPFRSHLSNVALAGLSAAPVGAAGSMDAEVARCLDHLSQLGVSRFTAPGRLQTPPIDWPHDGMPLFTPLARFTSYELAGV